MLHHEISNRLRAGALVVLVEEPDELLAVESAKIAAKAFVAGLEDVRSDMRVSVSEFELSAPQDLEQAEMAAWGKRIKNQLASISLGRSKEADEAGLSALLALAKCPVLQAETRNKIKAMVGDLRTSKITRVELKRSLDQLDVKVETATLAPRRTPSLEVA